MNYFILSIMLLLSLHPLVWVMSYPYTTYVTPGDCDFDDKQKGKCTSPSNMTKLNVLYVFRLQSDNTFLPLQEIHIGATPLWVELHPNNKWLYTAAVDNSADNSGWIHSFSIDPLTGMATLMNRVSSQGVAPVHLSFDATGTYIFASNFMNPNSKAGGGGSVIVFKLNTDGTLKPGTSLIQYYGDGNWGSTSHIHAIYAYPTVHTMKNKMQYFFAPDLTKDFVYILTFNSDTGILSPSSYQSNFSTPLGTGPRHMVINPAASSTQVNVYLILEFESAIRALKFDASTGMMTEHQTITTLPNGFNGENKAAELYLFPTTGSPSFLYASNRGYDDNSIVQYSIDSTTGYLTYVQHFIINDIRMPRHFRIFKNLLFAQGQGSDNIRIFHINTTSGNLLPTSASDLVVTTPVCLAIADFTSQPSTLAPSVADPQTSPSSTLAPSPALTLAPSVSSSTTAQPFLCTCFSILVTIVEMLMILS